MNLKYKEGFTLVELIIVIAILGIIALIAVPSLTEVQKRSQVNADIRTAEQIGKAVRIWLTDADINDAREREMLIVPYRTLAYLSGKQNFDEYISTNYVPKTLAEPDAEYYIRLCSDRVVVAIDYECPSLPSEIFKYDGNNVNPGVAYVEGVTNITHDILNEIIGT